MKYLLLIIFIAVSGTAYPQDFYHEEEQEIQNLYSIYLGVTDTAEQFINGHPDKALEILSDLPEKISNLSNELPKLLIEIEEESRETRIPEFQVVAGNLNDILSDLDKLTERVDELTDIAREKVFSSYRFRQEGERRLDETRTLIRQENYSAAKIKLEQASQRFEQALALLEDPSFRIVSENEVSALSLQIHSGENSLVVQEVRQSLIKARRLYLQSDFASANDVLVRARIRWADTNSEPNPEVEYWLELSGSAISVNSKRVISETDPLYSEMNQYLSKAQTDFLKAKELLEAGNKTEAEKYFESTEQSILRVQQFYPLNETARILSFQISQYRDPEAFKEVFKINVQNAMSLLKTNPQKAYIDLKALESIDPDFSGLQAAILEAEYASGLRVKPPDTEKLNKSRELFEKAYAIISRNVKSEYGVALVYLDEAIRLNPENSEAVVLKDRISAETNGTAGDVLSASDQQLYLDAVNEFAAGNYLKARIIVETLLKNPDNRNNTKLLQLQNRIEKTR